MGRIFGVGSFGVCVLGGCWGEGRGWRCWSIFCRSGDGMVERFSAGHKF